MIRVHVFCEGQTEETFVREVLWPHFERRNISLNPIVVRTSEHGKGGVSTYGKIKRQIEIKCKEDPKAWVTTLLDYYQFPQAFVKRDEVHSSIDHAQAVQAAFEIDIAQKNFIAYLVVHEFEALLFSAPLAFSEWFDAGVVEKIKNIREQFCSPEHINNGIATAPSKRIINICAGYDKPFHGSLIAINAGLNIIRVACPLFNIWLEKIETLSKKES